MKTYLEEIIEQYQFEKERLDRLISDAVEQGEYLSAHFHSISLRDTNYKLQIFNLLRDPYYDQKNHLRNMIPRIEALHKDLGIKNDETYITSMWDELEALNQKENMPVLDTQYIDDAIFDLVEKSLNSFKLILIKEQNLVLTFNLPEENLLGISFPPLSEIKEKHILEHKFPQLISLGFTCEESEQLTYLYNISDFKNALKLKELLSRIVFDVYYFSELDRPLTLERE